MLTTMITGSTAAGEPMLPHFQFSTTAQSEGTQRVNIRMSTFFPKIRGKFGTDCEKEWPVTIEMTSKGGMDEREFRSYFFNSVVPLFPDAEDVAGKRVIIKVDSGPGRMELGFLAEARTIGFIMYPGVRNTTAVTQDIDQSYDSRLIGNYSTSLPLWMVGIVVFGGTDPISKRIEKTQQATTHGNIFHATGGGHLTDDDIFLAAQKKVVKTQIKELQRRKESTGKMLDVERKAREIL
eukprot:CCRYP_011060-RA/>CCRYP_011060-RA protein AED:0.29 eAED:0.29 QI:0/0/0/1/0/0/3/0/236